MAQKSVNKVTILGTVGRDPEVKYTPSGTANAKFSVATNESYKDREGNWQERTEWHNILAWAKTAEIAGEYLHKGDRVYLEGKLQTSNWDDKQTGEKKYRTEIVVTDLVLIGGNKESAKRTEPQPEPNAHGAVITDDDIPF